MFSLGRPYLRNGICRKKSTAFVSVHTDEFLFVYLLLDTKSLEFRYNNPCSQLFFWHGRAKPHEEGKLENEMTDVWCACVNGYILIQAGFISIFN